MENREFDEARQKVGYIKEQLLSQNAQERDIVYIENQMKPIDLEEQKAQLMDSGSDPSKLKEIKRQISEWKECELIFQSI